ncbi:hypothetical protein HYY69_00640 [Candidatus Woesearchaeota archaeon]|nr:hypothetical protein [Candidatus Woesearchaeota archaeon]
MKYVLTIIGLLLVSIAFVGCSTNLNNEKSASNSPDSLQESTDTAVVQQAPGDVEETETTLNEAKTLEQELSDENFNNFEQELDEVNW